MQETKELWAQSLVGKVPWRRAWQLTPVFLPGESHGQRTLDQGAEGRTEGDGGHGLAWGLQGKAGRVG